MSVARVGVLVRKEFLFGSRSFFFIFAIITPLAVTFLFSLVFGTLFSDAPKLAVYDLGDSQFSVLAADLDSVRTDTYESEEELRKAVDRGASDLGLVLPEDYDSKIVNGEPVRVNAYIWGESLAKNRLILGTTILNLSRDIAGSEAPVEIVASSIGDAQAIPWEDRLLPLLVLMTVVLGGAMVPSSSLVEEKQNRTLTAVTMTPTSVQEVYFTKGFMGWFISYLMGILILLINGLFINSPLLYFVLALSAMAAAAFGVLLGAMIKDVTSLFATIKTLGLFLYAPAIIFLFPGIPQWIAQIFPTYYMLQPIIEIVQEGAGWNEVAFEIIVLIALIVVIILASALVIRRNRLQPG